jgi:hypothetical protein
MIKIYAPEITSCKDCPSVSRDTVFDEMRGYFLYSCNLLKSELSLSDERLIDSRCPLPTKKED